MTDFYALSVEEQTKRLTGLAVEALEEWGVEGCQPRLIKFRENAVFEVETSDGKPAALRVHRQGYHSDASLVSELQWMAMLGENGVLVPTPIATPSGDIVVNASTDDVPSVWKVDMLSWLPGNELGAIGEPLQLANRDASTLFHSIGKTMAAMHNVTANWPQQNSMIRHAWDTDGFVGDQPVWGQFWKLSALNEEQQDLFRRARLAIAEDLDNYGKSHSNYGMIHADLVPENVMLNGDQIQLIDFDDAGFGWHMFEIVTALHWLTEEPEYETMQSLLLAGYQSVRPLEQRDIDTMALFFAARSLTYLGWVHTRKNTETAIELTPILIDIAEGICSNYLNNRN